MISETLTRAEQIARLNDRARQGLDRTALVNFTRACLAEFCSDDTPNGLLAQAEMMKAMRQHAFVNDAHGERDFGQMTFRDMPVWFKIDYYDLDLEYGSEDPLMPASRAGSSPSCFQATTDAPAPPRHASRRRCSGRDDRRTPHRTRPRPQGRLAANTRADPPRPHQRRRCAAPRAAPAQSHDREIGPDHDRTDP